MGANFSKGLRITLLVYAIYSLLYGLVHVIAPQLVGAKDPAIERVLGAAVLAFAIGAGLAYFESAWDSVRIVVLVQVVWMILYAILMTWGLLAGKIIAAAWAPTIIGAVFGVLFLVFYVREGSAER